LVDEKFNPHSNEKNYRNVSWIVEYMKALALLFFVNGVTIGLEPLYI
jgi:hypothetical protein